MANHKIKAQVAIEFTIAAFCLFILLVAVAKIFAWFGHSIVERHKAYEASRAAAAQMSTYSNPGTAANAKNFYTQTPLNIFKDWNYKLDK